MKTDKDGFPLTVRTKMPPIFFRRINPKKDIKEIAILLFKHRHGGEIIVQDYERLFRKLPEKQLLFYISIARQIEEAGFHKIRKTCNV